MRTRTKNRPVVSTPAVVKVEPVKTLDVRADEALEGLVVTAGWDLEGAKRNLDEFRVNFYKDPAHTFEWDGSSAFDQAARLKVNQEFLGWVKSAQNSANEYAKPSSLAILKEVRGLLFDEVVRKARWPEHSTSFSSNEMSRCVLAHRTAMLVKLDDNLKNLGQ